MIVCRMVHLSYLQSFEDILIRDTREENISHPYFQHLLGVTIL